MFFVSKMHEKDEIHKICTFMRGDVVEKIQQQTNDFCVTELP